MFVNLIWVRATKIQHLLFASVINLKRANSFFILFGTEIYFQVKLD